MKGYPWQNFVIQLTVWVMVAGAAGAAGGRARGQIDLYDLLGSERG